MYSEHFVKRLDEQKYISPGLILETQAKLSQETVTIDNNIIRPFRNGLSPAAQTRKRGKSRCFRPKTPPVPED